MANLRPVLIIGLLFLGYMIWVQWQRDYGAPPATSETTVSQPAGQAQTTQGSDIPVPGPQAPEGSEDLPSAETHVAETPPQVTGDNTGPSQRALVTVTTDVLEVRIDPAGGTLVSATLLNYPVHLDHPDKKVQLLQPSGDHMYIAQSGLLSRQEAPNHTSPYRATRQQYALQSGSEELRVPLVWTAANGLRVTKTFVFHRGQYVIEQHFTVENGSPQAWSGSRYEQLQRSVPSDEKSPGFAHPERYSFFGIGFYNPEDKFEKVKFKDVADEPYKKTTRDGWLAMIQHYFFAAWIPPADQETTYSTQVITSSKWPRYIARAVSPAQQVAPGQTLELSSRLYLGPKLQDRLPDIAPGLGYTVNYGIFTVFSKPLFWLLEKIHSFTGNWGWAIVLLTVLIKGAFFKLTEAQYRSTARMRKLQPRIEQLKERYGDDRQRMSQAMMEMYKKEKVNPLGGCLPILVQIPIFIALYWVLLESVELRQAPFILWINNLSVRDPYFILPLLNAGFMFATQRLTPMVGMDPLQQKIMTMMPIAFSVMFAFFPAGLVLYWATNAGLSLAQQFYITRKIAAAG
ncbi:MAG: membrane protein insertase YidC [Lysobacterales bacterium]|jgi:YidC/Oxa1 family membrane protein insertase